MSSESSENPIEKNSKTNFFKRIATLKNIAVLIFLISIALLEYSLDLVEIAIGNILELTNGLRPQAGTIWELNEKDQIADTELEKLAQKIQEPKIKEAEINDVSQLRAELDKNQSVIVSAKKFKELYTQIPPRYAYDIIAPFDLLRLSHSDNWAWTKIVKQESNLACFFLDGDKQLLQDTYPPLTVLYNLPNIEATQQTSLDSMEFFRGRTFSPEQFFDAFNELPNTVKLQLINNPYLLIQWDENIQKVAISKYSLDNSVLIGFEILKGIYTEIYTFEASELAANYLISRLNLLYPELNLTFPERRYRNYEFEEF